MQSSYVIVLHCVGVRSGGGDRCRGRSFGTMVTVGDENWDGTGSKKGDLGAQSAEGCVCERGEESREGHVCVRGGMQVNEVKEDKDSASVSFHSFQTQIITTLLIKLPYVSSEKSNLYTCTPCTLV